MSSLAWSSPTRESDGVLLSAIPNEIYAEIFGYLRPAEKDAWIDAETRQLFSCLALVCRCFASVMLPWIFESLSFVEKDPYAQTTSTNSNKVSTVFCRKVLDNDPTALLLAKHVKRWSFQALKQQSVAFLSLYFEAMERMPNLVEIRLKNVKLTPDILKHLKNIPYLENLRVDTVSFSDSVEDKHLKRISTLRLKTLSIINDRHSAAPIFLRCLNLDSILHLQLFWIGHGWPSPALPYALETLDIENAEDGPRLHDILRQVHRLRTLRVQYLRSETTNEKPYVLPTHLPILESIEAPWHLCKKLIPGRPIHCVKVTHYRSHAMGLDDIGIIKQSTKPLTHLRLPGHLNANFSLHEHFPDLLELELWSSARSALRSLFA